MTQKTSMKTTQIAALYIRIFARAKTCVEVYVVWQRFKKLMQSYAMRFGQHNSRKIIQAVLAVHARRIIDSLWLLDNFRRTH